MIQNFVIESHELLIPYSNGRVEIQIFIRGTAQAAAHCNFPSPNSTPVPDAATAADVRSRGHVP